MNIATDSYTVAVSEISKSFNNTLIVNNISFDISESVIFGLTGPNGNYVC